MVLALTAGAATASGEQPIELQAGKPIVVGNTHTLQSRVLGQERTITVGVPRDYDKTESGFPVLYVLDGSANFPTVHGAVEFLARYGKIPPMIVVALHNAGNRTSEMTPEEMKLHGYEGTGDRFLEFFERELIPLIDEQYRTLPFRILHGHSHGAIIGTYAFARRPELFRWHLMMDMPPQRGDSYIEQTVFSHLSDHPDRTGRLVTVNRQYGWSGDDWKKLAGMASEGLYLDQIEIVNESHETMLYEGTYKGLRSLFHDYAVPETRSKTLPELERQYRLMSRDYGYEIEIPQRLLEDNILDMVFQQRGHEAQALHDYMFRVHGTGGNFRPWAEVIPEIIAAGPAEETLAEMLTYEPPTPDQMKPYLGSWQGTVSAPHPFPLRVIFDVENGQVVARTGTKRPDRPWGDPEPHVSLRLKNDGILEWGIYNNMRPFTIKMYSVRLENGSLVGQAGLRGGRIQNIAPEMKDEDMPKMEFVLSRRATGSD